MSLIDPLFSVGFLRKIIWKLWYPFLTRRLRDEEVLFLNYAFETDPPLSLKLEPADEPNRACIQLYHHVATQVELAGKRVLEVSCGHGGGASFLHAAPRALHRPRPESHRHRFLPTTAPRRRTRLCAG
ncbi:MAG TPA: hypothetical protein PLG56_10820 [Lacunisphaera sp.]|nr:hypothetical protein [Lacunisphaera sp.]